MLVVSASTFRQEGLMRNILFLLLLVIGCRGVPVETVRSSSLVIPNIMSGTVGLIEDGEVAPYCTGVWIGYNYIITAHHCVVMSLEEMIIRSEESELKIEEVMKTSVKKVKYIIKTDERGLAEAPLVYRDVDVVGLDAENDLALLKAKGEIPLHETISVADKIRIGERLHIIGHVQGLTWTYMEGVISAERVKDGSAMIQVSAPVYFGASGGGAFNEYGELVGITSFIYRAPNVGFFVDRKVIKKFLENHLVK